MNYIGALIGDYCGSIYEWNNTNKENPNDIEILKTGKFTDDSVLTIAIMDWLLSSESHSKEDAAIKLKEWFSKYPKSGFGSRFYRWAKEDSFVDNNSFGNGSAMRVSPCAYYAQTLDECLELAEKSASITHNHEEGIKGAKAISEAIYLARSGAGKDDIARIIEEDFGYSFDKSINEIGVRFGNHAFDSTCQVTVPEAITCFLYSNDFMDCIKKSIWIGGDSDTIAAMACPIAEAYYGIPHFIMETIKDKIPEDMRKIVNDFNKKLIEK